MLKESSHKGKKQQGPGCVLPGADAFLKNSR